MLTVHHLSKSFDIEPILTDVTFSLNPGERVGLVGPNGCGKTTLLRILAGLEQPEAGVVSFDPPHLRLGYLPQGYSFREGETLGGYLDLAEERLESFSSRLEELAGQLARSPDQVQLQEEYDRVLAELSTAAESAGQGPEVLASLGLGDFPLDAPVGHLSGGQKTRLALAKILLSAPQLLLLDEPTNHLDIPMLEWLEGWLAAAPAAALIVSHDRVFLDHSVNGILEIDPETHTTRRYAGNYTSYLEARLAERERMWQAFKDQQDEISRLRAAATRVRADAKHRKNGKGTGDTWAPGFFADRTKGTIHKAKNIEKRVERLLNDERVEKPRQGWQMRLDFGEVSSSGRDVLVLENLAVGYGQRALLRNLNLHLHYGARLAVVGPNGAGKTTLLRTIAGELPPLAGQYRLGANVHLGYMAQEQEHLDPKLNPLTTLHAAGNFTETEARAFLSLFLFTHDGVFVPNGKLSYGERARLSLARLVAQGCNFLMLDEPINHLDIPSRARFEQALSRFEGTVLAVVHDRYFIEGFATEVWEVGVRELVN